MIGTNIYEINFKILHISLFINLKQISLIFILNLSTKKYISCFLSLDIKINNMLINVNISKAIIFNFLMVSLSECP